MSVSADLGTMFGAVSSDTFLGVPACPRVDELDAAVAVLGVPSVTPYRSVGPYCANAPRAIRRAIAPYSASVHHVDFDLGRPIFPDNDVVALDLGDLPYDAANFAANRNALRQCVSTMLDRHAVPVLIGGDDSVPIPLFEAFAGRGEFTVVQIDAHIDWRDSVDGERFGLSSNMRRASEMAHIKHIVQIGQRGIGSAREQDYRDALDWGVKFASARELHRRGIDAAIDAIPHGSKILLAIDIDGLDPSVVPGVIGRGPGGLDYWQTVNIMHAAAERGEIAAFSLVEFVPERDVDDLGALVAARLVANALALITGQAKE